MTDFIITNHGSVCTITAVSDAAKKLADAEFEIEGWQGSRANFTTDHRAAWALAARLQSEGFDVRDGGSHY